MILNIIILHFLASITMVTLVKGAQVSDDVKGLADVNTDFGLDVYREVAKTSENVFISPYSISSALTLTYQGANGQTKTEMEDVLHFSELQELATVNTNFKSLIEAVFETGKEYLLKSANRLFGKTGKAFLPGFLNDLEEFYKAPLEEVDFAADAESARKRINSWVEEETMETIKNLIPRGVIDASTELVLANAIYFKGKWIMPFNASLTKDREFHVSDGETVMTPMMKNMGPYGWYASKLEFKGSLIRLPYIASIDQDDPKSGDVNMYLYLPSDKESLEQVESALTAEKLNRMITAMGSTNVKIELTMPKFTITQHMSVKKTLQTLGMTSAFGANADLSGMDGSKGLFITDVIHQAFVDVNEEGTEAAAATAVVVGRSGPLKITIDKPFLFFIREEDTGSILFLGRVKNPKTTNMARRSLEPAAGKSPKFHSHGSLLLFISTFLLLALV